MVFAANSKLEQTKQKQSILSANSPKNPLEALHTHSASVLNQLKTVHCRSHGNLAHHRRLEWGEKRLKSTFA